ncbi:MAG: cereblon family protein [Desulforegulaceae bacterium]|nr:cereblon family protein [Desulforegulaceae bacterium]
MIFFFKELDSSTLKKTKTIEKTLNSKSLFCKNCFNEITSENFAVTKNNSHIHSFANPYGYIFTIRCFSFAKGVISSGKDSSEFSWFNNYSWKICLCNRCMTHLGWEFANSKDFFYGLIDDKMV